MRCRLNLKTIRMRKLELTLVRQILIAADGSSSTINKALGLNNVTKLPEYPMLQARCTIDDASYARLPAVLRENGTTAFHEPDFRGFIAVYEAYQPSKALAASSFLFWAVILKPDFAQKLDAIPDGKDKAALIAETMESTGYNPDDIPTIIRMGDNVKMSSMSTSTKPTGWRKERPELGRTIFIGDSIHAMTRTLIAPCFSNQADRSLNFLQLPEAWAPIQP